MTTKPSEKTLVVVQMTGGNDFMNTLVPYTSGLYYDSRQTVRITEDRVLSINDKFEFLVFFKIMESFIKLSKL